MHPNKVTVVIPVYNMEEYIEKCLNSVVTQTLKEVEILCIDDCSTDNSEKIIKNFKDHRIRYIKLDKNSGSAIARNRGIAEATGEFIIFMDSDDYYYDNTVLEKLYLNAKLNNVNIIAGNLLVYYVKHNTKKPFIDDTYLSKNKFYSFKKEYCSTFNYQRFMFKRDFLIKNSLSFPNYLRRQDPVFLLKTMLLNDSFYGINDIVYVYRFTHKEINWNLQRKKDYISSCKENLSICKTNSMVKHHLWEFLEFRQSVLQENLFKIEDDIIIDVEETKKLISYALIKNSIHSKIQKHEKEYINKILEDIYNYPNKKIIIYGFGNIGIGLYEKIKHTHSIEQIIDKNLYGLIVDDHEISKNIKEVSSDNLIIVTIYNEVSKNQMIDTFIKNGILKEQIL